MHRLSILVLAAALTGCGDPMGTPCTLKSGPLGFGFSSDCKHQCMALKDVACPDKKTTVRMNVCSGAEGCTPGSCGPGAICYTVPDPFEEESYCVPDDYCGAGLSASELAAWEKAAAQRAAETRAKHDRKPPTKPTK